MGAPVRRLAALLLLAALGCGGSRQTAPVATSLDYTEPADTTQWRLAQDASSTSTHLVLNLLAPAGTSGMGVTLVLDVDGARASWGPAAGSALVGTGGYLGPLALKASLKGAELRVLASQENPTPPVAYAGAPVLTVALDLAAGAPPGSVSFTVSQAGHLAAPRTLPSTITVAVGTLTAK